MRGVDSYSESLFTTVRLESFVPANYPLARDPGRDLLPELPLELTPKRRRTWRAHSSSPCQLLHPSCRSSHKHLLG